MTSRINCNRTSECPKGNTVGSRDIELNFIFFGCWGVYCKDGPNVIYEPSVDQYDREAIRNDEIAFKEKLNRPDININVGMYDEFWMEQPNEIPFLTRTNILYGQRTVARLMEDYSKEINIKAVLIGGDNVYQDSFDPIEYSDLYQIFRTEHRQVLNISNITEKEKKLKIKKVIKKFSVLLHNIDKQYKVGFLECFKNIMVQEYLVGIGNHDIKSCELFNDEINLFKKNILGMYFNYTYTLNTGKIVNFIFIDTNMYDYEDDREGNPEQASYCSGNYTQQDRNIQESWLTNVLNNNINSWNILIGHIPFKYVSSKHNNAVKTAKYFDNFIEHFNDRIDLYLCADKHNQQYLKHPNRPPEVICGSGGTEPDIFSNLDIHLEQATETGDHRYITDINSVKYFESVFGFTGLNITNDKILIDFRGINVLETRKQIFEERIINTPITFTVKFTDKIDRSEQ